MSEPGNSAAADSQALIYARELAQLQRLRRAYEHLLPEGLDPRAPALPPPVVRTATALFTDLRGFTGISERFADDPAGLLDVINAHFSTVVRAVTRCGGIVEKFVGDGMLATFGARQELPDHHERALAAALGVVGANEALNRQRAAEWGFRLDMGVGCAAGKVVVGAIGPPARAELGVMGDPINVAARLVASARPGEVLLAASVYSAAASQVRADLFSQAATVRGRTGTIDIYRIDVLGTRAGDRATA